MKFKYFFSIAVVAFFVSTQSSVALAVTGDAACTSKSNAQNKFVCTETSGMTAQAKVSCTAGLCAGSASRMCCNSLVVASNNSAQVGSAGAVNFTNPLQFKTVEGLLGSIMGAVQKIIVTLALVAITIGALMYVLSSGDSKTIEKAKEAISAALIGLALAIAAPSMLKELAGILGWGGTTAIVSSSLSQIAIRILNFLLGSFGILSLIMMIIGSILYLTSAGDEDRMKKGKEIFKYSVLGIVIAMSAMILVRQIAVFFAA